MRICYSLSQWLLFNSVSQGEASEKHETGLVLLRTDSQSKGLWRKRSYSFRFEKFSFKDSAAIHRLRIARCSRIHAFPAGPYAWRAKQSYLKAKVLRNEVWPPLSKWTKSKVGIVLQTKRRFDYDRSLWGLAYESNLVSQLWPPSPSLWQLHGLECRDPSQSSPVFRFDKDHGLLRQVHRARKDDRHRL